MTSIIQLWVKTTSLKSGTVFSVSTSVVGVDSEYKPSTSSPVHQKKYLIYAALCTLRASEVWCAKGCH